MRLFSNFTSFLARSKEEDLSLLMRRRVIVGTLFPLFAIAVLCTMSFLAIITGELLLLTINLIFAVFLGIFIYILKKTTHLQKILNISSAIMGLFGLFYYFYSGVSTNTFLWFYTYPLVTISISGRKTGFLHFIVLYVILISGSIISWSTSIPIGTEFSTFVRFILSLLFVFILGSFMEQTSEDESEMLVAQNEALLKAQQDLQELTIRDSLTDLFNRRYLDEVLPLGMSQSRRYNDELAIIMIDVDHFKKYNDHYGHVKGDEALKTVADVLKTVVRRNTDYVCRYGGEEFAIIMNKSSAAAVDRTADNILQELKKRNVPHIYGEEGRLTVSMGTATADQLEVDTQQSLIERADSALYQAKRLGRNQYCKL